MLCLLNCLQDICKHISCILISFLILMHWFECFSLMNLGTLWSWIRDMCIRGRQFKKVFLLRTFFNRFWPKSNWSAKHFLFNLNLELHSGLKVRGSEINFINKKLLESKNPRGFVTSTFKTGITNPRGFFDLSNFLLIKLISDPLTLRPLCSSRFRSNKKCLVDQLLLGQNLLKNVLKGVP